ncbi:hypothetical protein K438DRAFT_1782587 [Mycena galopus ATCC 62051]|nr:hypothetical protein K438DRAFT_1782587 [Mycena galopus ATCC 62051]
MNFAGYALVSQLGLIMDIQMHLSLDYCTEFRKFTSIILVKKKFTFSFLCDRVVLYAPEIYLVTINLTTAISLPTYVDDVIDTASFQLTSDPDPAYPEPLHIVQLDHIWKSAGFQTFRRLDVYAGLPTYFQQRHLYKCSFSSPGVLAVK